LNKKLLQILAHYQEFNLDSYFFDPSACNPQPKPGSKLGCFSLFMQLARDRSKKIENAPLTIVPTIE
jgi:hypothetical protein